MMPEKWQTEEFKWKGGYMQERKKGSTLKCYKTPLKIKDEER